MTIRRSEKEIFDSLPDKEPFGISIETVRTVGGALGNSARIAILITIWKAGKLSATEAAHRYGITESISHCTYHLRELKKLGVIEEVGNRRGRGSWERFYGVTGFGRAVLKAAVAIADPAKRMDYDSAADTATFETRPGVHDRTDEREWGSIYYDEDDEVIGAELRGASGFLPPDLLQALARAL